MFVEFGEDVIKKKKSYVVGVQRIYTFMFLFL